MEVRLQVVVNRQAFVTNNGTCLGVVELSVVPRVNSEGST
jgi:hypothetical protein